MSYGDGRVLYRHGYWQLDYCVGGKRRREKAPVARKTEAEALLKQRIADFYANVPRNLGGRPPSVQLTPEHEALVAADEAAYQAQIDHLPHRCPTCRGVTTANPCAWCSHDVQDLRAYERTVL